MSDKRRTLEEIAKLCEPGYAVEDDDPSIAADLRHYAAELAELRRLLEPARMDTKERDWTDGPKTVNDLLWLMTCCMADYMPTELVPNDEYFGAWERAVRPFIEKLFAENARLQSLVTKPDAQRIDNECLSTTNHQLNAELAELRTKLRHADIAQGEGEAVCEQLEAENARLAARLQQYEPKPGHCEHGIQDGEYCEPCNREYKRAAIENGFDSEAAEAAKEKT